MLECILYYIIYKTIKTCEISFNPVTLKNNLNCMFLFQLHTINENIVCLILLLLISYYHF